jgi:alpha-galactosidase
MNTLDKQEGLEKYAGPGAWNDPDLLVTGLFGKGKSSSAEGRFKGCNLVEYRSQFTLWCMLAAPLMVNLDVRVMPDSVTSILLNKELIAIDQDSLGRQCSTVYKQDGIQVFQKPLSGGRYAICVLNRNDAATAWSFRPEQAGLRGKWSLHDVLNGQKDHALRQEQGSLAPHDCRVFILTALP